VLAAEQRSDDQEVWLTVGREQIPFVPPAAIQSQRCLNVQACPPTCAHVFSEAALRSGGVLAPWMKAVSGKSTVCLITRASAKATFLAATWLRHTTKANRRVRGDPCKTAKWRDGEVQLKATKTNHLF